MSNRGATFERWSRWYRYLRNDSLIPLRKRESNAKSYQHCPRCILCVHSGLRFAGQPHAYLGSTASQDGKENYFQAREGEAEHRKWGLRMFPSRIHKLREKCNVEKHRLRIEQVCEYALTENGAEFGWIQ